MTVDPLVKAELAELAAKAEVTRLKMEQGKHWEGELEQEVRKLASLATGVANRISNRSR